MQEVTNKLEIILLMLIIEVEQFPTYDLR
jgi:hypothetical protein